MLLSRVAESLYWAGPLPRAGRGHGPHRPRAHRADRRPARCPCRRRGSRCWRSSASREAFDALHDQTDEESIVRFLVADAGNPGSVVSCVTQARENLRSTREILPRDGWLVVNDTFLFAESHRHDGVGRRSRGRFLDRIVGDAPARRRHPLGDDEPRRGVRVPAPRPGARAGRHDDPGARRAGRPRSWRRPARRTATSEHAEVQWMSVLARSRRGRCTTAHPRAGQRPRGRALPAHRSRLPPLRRRLPGRVEAGLAALPRGEEVLPAVRAAEVELSLVDPTRDGRQDPRRRDGRSPAVARRGPRPARRHLPPGRGAGLTSPCRRWIRCWPRPCSATRPRPPASTRRSTRPAWSARSGAASWPRWPAWVGPRSSSAGGRPTA